MPSDAEVIERLRGWAEEFDELDPERYSAQEFIEWLELEHRPARQTGRICAAPRHCSGSYR